MFLISWDIQQGSFAKIKPGHNPGPVKVPGDHPSMVSTQNSTSEKTESWGSEMVSTFIENHRGFLKQKGIDTSMSRTLLRDLCSSAHG